MAWAWIRPIDETVLAGRPLLDLGVGDGQTLAALTSPADTFGIDESSDALAAARQTGVGRVARALAEKLPYRDAAFATVLAADLLHHLDEARLGRVIDEAGRVLRSGGVLVAWWYETRGRDFVGSPRFPRLLTDVSDRLHTGPFEGIEQLELVANIEGPPTVGVVARRA